MLTLFDKASGEEAESISLEKLTLDEVIEMGWGVVHSSEMEGWARTRVIFAKAKPLGKRRSSSRESEDVYALSREA